MPNEIVRLQVLLDTPQGIEERLAALDAIIEKLKSNSTVKLNVDAKGLDVLGNSAKKYLDTINAQMSATPLQRQIEALTGVSRQYKSAAESAKVFLEIEKKVGTATGGTFSNLTQLSSAGFQSYLSSVEGLEAASVKAAGSIRAAGSDFQRFTVTAQASGKDVQTFTYAVDTSTGAVYKLDRGLVTASSGLAQTGEQAKLASNSLGNMLAQFLQFQLAYRVISTVISSLKEALAELKRVDTELVNIQKVTKATSGEMDALSKKAFEVGSTLGVAASDYLASVTKWARAGYGSLADELGELSVRTQKVGDVQEETANQFLLSVDAAYQYRGNIAELTKVLDGANEISNNYATSVEKLAEGMGLVSSLAAQAGMKVEETMAAIGTITAVTQESGSSAARALRALILNIQGSTEIEIDEGSGERWSEDEIQRTAAAFGELNIATRTYKDGLEQLRNPMEVIGEISEKRKKGLISEVQLQELVASLGGKVRSNQLMALIDYYDMYEKMLQTYSNSVGSADQELEIYLNSWEAKSARLKNQWTELVASFQGSEISKGILDVGNALLSVANTYIGNVALFTGTIGTLNTALKAFAGTEYGGKLIARLKEIPAAFSAAQAAAGGFAGGIKGIVAAVHTAFGPIGLILAGVYAAVKAFDYFIVTAKEQAEIVDNLEAEYQGMETALEDLKTQLEETGKAIEKLNQEKSAGDFTILQQEELERLQAQSGELERQILLQEKLNEAKRAELARESKKALDKGTAEIGFFDGQGIALIKAIFNQIAGNDNNALNTFSLKAMLYSKDMETQVKILGASLDRLREKRDAFLSEHGAQEGWTKRELEDFKTLEGQISDAESMAARMYTELQGYIANLDDPEAIQYWSEVGDALFAAAAPAASLTIQLNTLAGAMDTATQNDFLDYLKEIQADGLVTEEEVQALIGKFPVLNVLLDQGGRSVEELARYFTEAAAAGNGMEYTLEALGEQIGATGEQGAALAKLLENTASQLKELQNAQEELNTSGRLSGDTLAALAEEFTDLAPVVARYTAGLASDKELQEELGALYEKTAQDYKRAIVEKSASSEEFYQEQVLENQKLLKFLQDTYQVDANQYKTLAELKVNIEQIAQQEIVAQSERALPVKKEVYVKDAENFRQAEVSKLAAAAARIAGEARLTNAAESGRGKQKYSKSNKNQQQFDLESLLPYFNIPDIFSDTDAKKSGASSGAKTSSTSVYEQEIQAVNSYISELKTANEVLEHEEADSYTLRIANLKKGQERYHQAANYFRNSLGLTDSSDWIQQLKAGYHQLGDEIASLQEEMASNLKESHQKMLDDLTAAQAGSDWELDLFQKNRKNADRTLEEVAADNEKIVAAYRERQEELHALAERFREMGYDESSDLIQKLSDAWWSYQEKIDSVYQNLTERFQAYIGESAHSLKELERQTGTAGAQLAIYTERIAEAQKALALLQKTNQNGKNDSAIQDIQDQIWSDEDATEKIRQELWDELEDKMSEILDGVQDEIDEAQSHIDGINKRLKAYDKALEEALNNPSLSFFNESLQGAGESISAAIERLTDELEAEDVRLDSLTAPLKDSINGYYQRGEDGNLVYVPGLDDQLDDLKDQLDAVNEAWDAQQKREEERLALEKKQLAIQEAIKKLEQAQLDLQTARNERVLYTLKDGVWAWRADEQAISDAEQAVEDAEKAKEDAVQDLQDYEEEQKHQAIVKRLEEQIAALERQKELINKQIDLYQKESDARKRYLQSQLDQWEAEKSAWEKYYEDLKAQYDSELAYWTNRREELEEDYDRWKDQWADIQKGTLDASRSFEEILSDIARYGTPKMQEQITHVTDLLSQMGISLDRFNEKVEDAANRPSGGTTGGGNDGEDTSYWDTVDRMRENAEAWHDAMAEGDQQTANWLYQENQRLGASIGASFHPSTGLWTDRYGNTLFTVSSSHQSGGSDGFQSDSGAASGGGSSGGMSGAAQQIHEIKLAAFRLPDSQKRSYFHQAQSIAVAAGALPAAFSPIVNDWHWYDSRGNQLFDQGGIASGKGALLKGTRRDEVVLGPALSLPVLSPEKNAAFDRFAKSLGLLFASSERFEPAQKMAFSRPEGGGSHIDRHDITINGVTIGESMLQRPLAETLSLLGLHMNEFR